MPWLDTPKSDFVSALEFFWNQHGSRMDKLLLIACGSASSWIQKNLINARGGLYNRITHRMQLHPFNLYETQLFLQHIGVHLTQYQIIEIYMTMGGIPFYLKEIEKGKSVPQLIDDICFSKQGLLYNEYEQLYYSLFRSAANHLAIVEALANHPMGLSRNDIATRTKINESQLSRSLSDLEECGFITFFKPLFNRKKDGTYKLTDFYSLFYLKYIAKNKTSGHKIWSQLSKEQTYITWSGYAFEHVCMSHIEQIKAALGISGVYTQQGSWRFKGNEAMSGTQVDVVIDRADQVIHIGEAKFTKEPFILTKEFAEKMSQRKSIFKQASQTSKAVFTLLLTPLPAVQNNHYHTVIDNEVNADCLFAAASI
jgi:DNA-binding MarR family transcriptional regulator